MAHSSISQKSPLRIMVVDDRETITMTFELMLEILGYDVRVANNGPDAITVARSFLPHIVLLDIGLPDMDGYEVCQKLRREPGLEKSVLIAQTGHSQQEYKERSITAGFDHHLVKPVTMDHLQQLFASLNIGNAA